MRRQDVRRKVAALLAVFVLLGLAHHFGVLQRFGDPAGVARTLRGLRGWGYLAFVASYALLQPFGVPGTVFVVAAPLIWPWPVAFVLSMTGTMAASVVGFSFARFVARDWVESKIPARFRKYDEALATHAFRTVFLLRFVFWMPQLLHTFLGVSKVPFWTHFWASLAGYAVPLFLLSYFGQKLFDALKAAPGSVWLAIAAGAALVLLCAWATRRHRARAS
jgi:uncharacterized membrane protein YdjX (TVP38/TMEM64 family)